MTTDPLHKYPRPPFEAQAQSFPGKTARMAPEPDHGEESYKGSGKLAGKVALVTGGDSGIGRAVAIAFSREGADVAIGYMPEGCRGGWRVDREGGTSSPSSAWRPERGYLRA